ncbi:MAG: DUF4190 domain-containing protein [Planctomycetota bacterium]
MFAPAIFPLMILFFLGGVLPMLALIFGIVSLVRISRSEGRLRGRGLAVASIVLGGMGLLSIPVALALLVPVASYASGGGESLAMPTVPAPSESSASDDATHPVLIALEITEFQGSRQDAQDLALDLEERFERHRAVAAVQPSPKTDPLEIVIELQPARDALYAELAPVERRASLVREVHSYFDWLKSEREAIAESTIRTRFVSRSEVLEYPGQSVRKGRPDREVPIEESDR